MIPTIKRTGGKSKEIDTIKRYLPPVEPSRYFEPFLGGGSVWLSLKPSLKSYLNDYSPMLVSYWEMLRSQDIVFRSTIENMMVAWNAMERASHIYINWYKGGEDFSSGLVHWLESMSYLPKFGKTMAPLVEFCFKAVNRTRYRINDPSFSDEDLRVFFETALKSGLYTYTRYLLNDPSGNRESEDAAIFFFIQEYAYAGMSRYNLRGEFNVPYGGKSYNGKDIRGKIQPYYLDQGVINKMSYATFTNYDFETFLQRFQPTRDDFIFLDPPYDSTFSSYENIAFLQLDHKRLADWLSNDCEAKFMLVIKNTPFIWDLYRGRGFNILSHDKKYTWDIKGRNHDKRVSHLMITNY